MNSARSLKQVVMASAFGRGEALAIALDEQGFAVRILDFTAAFPAEYGRGGGPFPVLLKAHIPAQQEFLHELDPLAEGLTLWLRQGPVELTGPLHDIHAKSLPELRAWKNHTGNGDFSLTWLQHFLRDWTSPYATDIWASERRVGLFQAEAPMGIFPGARELSLFSFERAQAFGLEVQRCSGLHDVLIEGQRILEVEVDAGSAVACHGQQWVWFLSSMETQMCGEMAARKVFPRGVRTPEWAWLSFEGQIQRGGHWSHGLPRYCILLGDIFLPWTYANATVIRRLDETRMRFWLKVPRARVRDIDSRRAWAGDLLSLLQQRMPMAKWVVDSAQWSVCPHSEVYAPTTRGERLVQWKNWDWISAETLPRLDLAIRFEREAAALRRLQQWGNDQVKKQGAERDRTLHAP